MLKAGQYHERTRNWLYLRKKWQKSIVVIKNFVNIRLLLRKSILLKEAIFDRELCKISLGFSFIARFRQVSRQHSLGRGQEKGNGVGESREQSELTRTRRTRATRPRSSLHAGPSENNYAGSFDVTDQFKSTAPFPSSFCFAIFYNV